MPVRVAVIGSVPIDVGAKDFGMTTIQLLELMEQEEYAKGYSDLRELPAPSEERKNKE